MSLKAVLAGLVLFSSSGVGVSVEKARRCVSGCVSYSLATFSFALWQVNDSPLACCFTENTERLV